MARRHAFSFKSLTDIWGTLTDNAKQPSLPPVPVSEINTTDKEDVGKYYFHDSGAIYRKVKSLSGLSYGHVVSYANAIATNTVVAHGSSNAYVDYIIVNTGTVSYTANALSGKYVFVKSVVGGGSPNSWRIQRIVLGNDASTGSSPNYNTKVYVAALRDDLVQPNIYDGNRLSTTTGLENSYPSAATELCIVYEDWVVRLANTTSYPKPAGVALGTVTAGNYTIIQVQGSGLVRWVDGTTALTHQAALVTTSTDGVVKTIATGTAAELAYTRYVGYSLIALAASSTETLVPAYIDCMHF